MQIIYLVRHAHCDWLPNDNRSLSPKGLQDAERVGDILNDFPIARIYSSPYLRAHQTITPLANRKALPINEIKDLRERELGNCRCKSFEEAVRITWEDPSFAHPGGETNLAAQKRAVDVVRKTLSQGSNDHIVFSTHGNLLALILQHFEPAIDFSFWRSLTMPDIYSLKVTEDNNGKFERLWKI